MDALEGFEAHRALLFGIAYRMLGSAADADDILQEARLRWLAAPWADVHDVRAYLVTIVSRLCLDHLGSARVRREQYVGPWLPEPIATAPDADPESLSMAFLLLLERLSPAERAAFLLSEVFDYTHAEVAATLGKSEEACRQLAARARRHVREGRARSVDRAEHARVLGAFVVACASGDLAALERLLADDVVVRSDGGGRARAARRPVVGRHRVVRLLVGLTRKGGAHARVEPCEVNGLPAVRVREDGVVTSVISLDLQEGRIAAVFIVRNPDKLARVS
ncbi:MAG TPA: RNA polymerase sigma-70 factor [Kofleriaceae bacterium]|nr:RNA polymerase sigma-70 factor [Kofleriaceae bacterium]